MQAQFVATGRFTNSIFLYILGFKKKSKIIIIKKKLKLMSVGPPTIMK